MTEPKERMKIDLGDIEDMDLSSNQDAVPPDLIKATSAQAGFRPTDTREQPTTAKAKTPRPRTKPAEPAPRRRKARRKTGRIHQINTRLTQKTNDAIYDYADRHNLMIAQVIEQAVELLIAAEKNGQGTR